MRRSSKKLPSDSNQRAAEIVALSVEEQTDETAGKSSEISKYLAQIGRKGGLKGGRARADNLGWRKRRSIARKAARVRWGKKAKR